MVCLCPDFECYNRLTTTGGISNFFSQLIVGFGYTPEQSLLYGTPGGAVEVVFLIACGWAGDRYGYRVLISMIGLCTAMIGMILIVALPLSNNSGRLAGYYLTQASPTPFVALLSLISSNVAGYTKKTTVAAMYLIGYCVGNIIGIPSLLLLAAISADLHIRPSNIPPRRCATLCACRSNDHRLLGHLPRHSSFHPFLLRLAEQEESPNPLSAGLRADAESGVAGSNRQGES